MEFNLEKKLIQILKIEKFIKTQVLKIVQNYPLIFLVLCLNETLFVF